MKKYYFYIIVSSPEGMGGYFYRDDKHPLDPEAMQRHQKILAMPIQLKTGQLILPEHIAFISLYELPTEVAKARWPEDFKQ